MGQTSAQIQGQLNNIDEQIQAGAPQGQIDRLNDQKVKLQQDLIAAHAAEASQAEREQTQAEKVDSITLPLDFNELFENTQANDMIIEVVKEFQTQAYADHNAEVAQLTADWQSKLKASITDSGNTVTQLQNQIASQQNQIAQLTLDKQDAESKRDAAANELDQAKQEIERLNSHVSDLRQQIASAPAPKSAIEIGSSDRLAELANKARESNAEKAARGLARWNANNPDLAVPALDIPALPQVSENDTADAVTPNDFRNADPATESSPVAQPGTEATEQTGGEDAIPTIPAEESPLTLESVKAQLDALAAAHSNTMDRVAALEGQSGQVAA